MADTFASASEVSAGTVTSARCRVESSIHTLSRRTALWTHVFLSTLLARDALALIVAQCLSIHLSICVSICLSATAWVTRMCAALRIASHIDYRLVHLCSLTIKHVKWKHKGQIYHWTADNSQSIRQILHSYRRHWLSGVVDSALGMRTRGPGFESRVAPIFHCRSNLGQVVYTHCLLSFSAPRNRGTKGSFQRLSVYGD